MRAQFVVNTVVIAFPEKVQVQLTENWSERIRVGVEGFVSGMIGDAQQILRQVRVFR